MSETSLVGQDFDRLEKYFITQSSLLQSLQEEKNELISESRTFSAEKTRLLNLIHEKQMLLEQKMSAEDLNLISTIETTNNIATELKMKTEIANLRFRVTTLQAANVQLQRQADIHKAENVNLANQIINKG